MSSRVSALERIPKKILYSVLFLTIIIPTIRPIGIPVPPDRYADGAYDAIMKIPPGSVVLFTQEAGKKDEFFTLMVPVLQLLINQNLKVVIISFSNNAAGVFFTNEVMPLLKLGNKQYGVDFIHLGYYIGGENAYASFAKDIRSIAKNDIYGKPIDSYAILKDVKSAADISFCVLEGEINEPVRQILTPYKIPAVGLSMGSMASSFLAYMGSHLQGVVISSLGAARIEYRMGMKGMATLQSDIISSSQLTFIVVLLLGNASLIYHKLFRRGSVN